MRSQYAAYFPYLDKRWFGESFQYDEMPPANWLVEVSGIPFGLMGGMPMLVSLASRVNDPEQIKLEIDWDVVGLEPFFMPRLSKTFNRKHPGNPVIL